MFNDKREDRLENEREAKEKELAMQRQEKQLEKVTSQLATIASLLEQQQSQSAFGSDSYNMGSSGVDIKAPYNAAALILTGLSSYTPTYEGLSYTINQPTALIPLTAPGQTIHVTSASTGVMTVYFVGLETAKLFSMLLPGPTGSTNISGALGPLILGNGTFTDSSIYALSQASQQGDNNNGNYLLASSSHQFNQNGWQRTRTSDGVPHYAQIAPTTAGTSTVWTPSGSNKFRILGGIIATDTAQTLTLLDGSTAIAQFYPAANATIPFNFSQGGLLSSTGGNKLNISYTATAGNIAITVYGLEN